MIEVYDPGNNELIGTVPGFTSEAYVKSSIRQKITLGLLADSCRCRTAVGRIVVADSGQV